MFSRKPRFSFSLLKQLISLWRTDMRGVYILRIYNITHLLFSKQIFPIYVHGFHGFSLVFIDFHRFVIDFHRFSLALQWLLILQGNQSQQYWYSLAGPPPLEYCGNPPAWLPGPPPPPSEYCELSRKNKKTDTIQIPDTDCPESCM